MKGASINRRDVRPQPTQVCDFLPKPFPECYCMNISSSNITKMLSYCIGDFRACPVYLARVRGEHHPAAADLS